MNTKTSQFTVIVCLLFLEAILADDYENEESNFVESTVYQTQSGPVSGVVLKTDDGKEVNAFFGIPYAEPPLGELRFKPPQKIKPWKSVLQATKPMPICQQNLNLKKSYTRLREALKRPWSEDCLHLNVWSPKPNPKKTPVLFYIHGGSFMMGSGLWNTDGTIMASEGVVVVSINYRLGVFGFFNLGTTEAPGNVGLLDQNLALRWVKENVHVFGGDPVAVTLMGISADSASVGYHLLAPKSSGLFQKAIMMSGSPTNVWANMEPETSIKESKHLFQLLGCQSSNSTESLRCIQNKHAEDLLDVSGTDRLYSNFVPTVDGEFVLEHPSISLETGRINTAVVLVGSVKDEGTMFLKTRNPDQFQTKDGRLFRRDFAGVIARSWPKLADAQVRALDAFYTDWANPNDPIMLRNATRDFYSDSLFNCHINEFADKLCETESTVYRYVYGHRTSAASKIFPSWTGVIHGQDRFPLLGPPKLLNQFPKTSRDIEAAQRFRMHILSFVSKGNPNIRESGYPEEPEWPEYDSKRRYLHFGIESFVSSNFRERQCATWLRLIPLLQEKKC